MKMIQEKTSSSLIQDLQRSGMRITPQRIAICELLAGITEHPTAQQIYETLRPRFPSLSLATVYNTLQTLVSLGSINELGRVGGDAAHYDPDTDPHINLMCVSCRRIVDLSSEHIRQVETEVENSSGYRLLGARVLYYGLCPQCQALERQAG
jgi:Fur family peroxide stress response transcriptional regulator